MQWNEFLNLIIAVSNVILAYAALRGDNKRK